MSTFLSMAGISPPSSRRDQRRLRTSLTLPGFVDAHTHACFAGSRVNEWLMRVQGASYEEIGAMGGGILSTVESTRSASLEQLIAETEKHLIWLMRHGTTCAEVKSGYGLDPETEKKMFAAIDAASSKLGILIRKTYLGAHAIPKGRSEGEYLDECIRTLAEVAPACDYVDMFVEEGYFSANSCRRYVDSSPLLIRLHVDQLKNSGGAALAAEVGAVSADHLEQTDEAGIKALAEGEVTAGLVPGSVFGLRKPKYANGRAMIDAGIRVYLATDFNPGSSPVCSMPFCMRLAVDYMGMTPEEALTASTYNPACNLGLNTMLGSIEPGKRADLSIFPVQDYREIAYYVGVLPTEVILGGKRGVATRRPE